MAKTEKDKPFSIVVKEAYKTNPIQHEHDKLGATYSRTKSEWYVFEKSQSADIAAFENFLQAEGLDYQKHEENRAKDYFRNLYYSDPYYWHEIAEHQNETGVFLASHFVQPTEHKTAYNKYEIPPKRIYFRVKKEHLFQEYTGYCTDYEHFNPESFTDTRDNKPVTCLPHYDALPHRYFGRQVEKERHPRSERKATLKELAQMYNNGEELDEDDPILHEEFKADMYYFYRY